MNMYGKRGIIALGIILFAIGAYYFYLGVTSGGVNIEISTVAEAEVGVPLDINLSIRNESNSTLKDVKVSLDIPNGAIVVGAREGQIIETRSVNDIRPSSSYEERFQMIFTEGKEEGEKLTARVSYTPESIGARFEKETEKEIPAVKEGLTLEAEVSETIFPGEEFEVILKYKNTAQAVFESAELELDYPKTVTITKTDPSPIGKEKRLWNIGDIEEGSEGEIVINATTLGESGTLVINASLNAVFLGKSFTVQNKKIEIAIAPSPLSLKVTANEDPNYIAKPGDMIRYTLSYENNTRQDFEDIVIQAKLGGEMFEFGTMANVPSFNNFTKTTLWNKGSNPELEMVGAGAKGTLTFDIKLKSDYPIKRLSDKNFVLDIEAKIESPTTTEGVAAGKTVGIANLETKVMGQINVDALGLFRDAGNGVINNGPLPPQVGKATEFTIHWVLKNYGTDVNEVEVSAELENGVVFGKEIKVSDGRLEFGGEDGKIVWKIPRVNATRGVISSPLEAVFQIRVTPRPEHLGTAMPMLSMTIVKATDSFTNLTITNFDQGMTTMLTDDPTIKAEEGTVIQ